MADVRDPRRCDLAVTGRLAYDPELKYIPSGAAVCSMRVAVTRGFGEKEHTLWFSAKLWGKRGEKAAEKLHKGDLVYVQGELSEESYAKKETGEMVTNLVINANSVDALSWPESSDGDTKPAPAPAPQQAATPEDGIPF